MKIMKKFIFLLLGISNFVFVFGSNYNGNKIFTIMLDPSGDAQNAGRQIDDNLERGVTLQFSQKLKEELEDRYGDIRVVLTRFPGETLQPLQNANFSNRLNVDFYLSIHFYKEYEVKPKVFLYTFSYNDEFITKRSQLYFYSYDQAHLINKDSTKKWANIIKNSFLKCEYKKIFDLEGLFKLPFKPLIGVKSPAIGIELGLRKKDDWINYLEAFISGIGAILETVN